MKTLKLSFDPTSPKLAQSSHPLPPFEYVDGLRKSFPHVWSLGLSELADDSFDIWTQYNEGVQSEAIDKWMIQREKWADAHAKDCNHLLVEEPTPRNCRPLVNLLKWGIVPETGFAHMRKTMKSLIEGDWGEQKISFERMYEDYPDSAVENAKRALAYHDTPAGKRTGTPQVWSISRKLASRSKLTFSEIKILASYLPHRSHSGKDYETDPSAIAWEAVGGTNGVIWAKRRVDSMQKQVFENVAPNYKSADKLSNEICNTCLMCKKGFCESFQTPVFGGYVCDDWNDSEESKGEDLPFMGAGSAVRKHRKSSVGKIGIHRASTARARELITDDKVNEAPEWEGMTTSLADSYIRENGWVEYSKWFLGIRDEMERDSKQRYVYPISSDFSSISKAGLKSARIQSAQRAQKDIFEQAGRLLDMLDARTRGENGEENPVVEEAKPTKSAEPKSTHGSHGCKFMLDEDTEVHGEVVGVENGEKVVEVMIPKDGRLYRTGQKINVGTAVYASEYEVSDRRVEVWNGKAHAKTHGTFDTIEDSNGNVIDYKGVTFRGYASTNEDVTKADRGGDYLHKGAFKKTINEFMKNPVMLADHRNTTESMVGTYTKVQEDENGLWVEGQLSDSPDVSKIRFLVAEGHLKTLSIGGLFYYAEDGKGIEKVDLMEISLVAIPMNPDAIVGTQSFGDDLLKKVFKKG